MQKIFATKAETTVTDPPFIYTLFNTTAFAWLWLLLRLFVGWQWLSAGWGKLSGGVWGTGAPLKGFWEHALATDASGKSAITYDWYHAYIQFMYDHGWYTWFSHVVMWGEILIGLGIIFGALVGVAAFFGAFMNWNFIMAGAASTNGMLLVLMIILLLAWKVAGWYGLDRWLLPILGTPWQPGQVFQPKPPQGSPATS